MTSWEEEHFIKDQSGYLAIKYHNFGMISFFIFVDMHERGGSFFIYTCTLSLFKGTKEILVERERERVDWLKKLEV